MGSLNNYLARSRQTTPATDRPPRPAASSPEDGAVHLIRLLGEGAQPKLINGRLYLAGRVTSKAQEIADHHAATITVLLAAFAAGTVDRQALAGTFAEDEFGPTSWPGTAEKPARWAG